MGIDERSEWLEADGLGGFASGTASGIRTRRYHGLLLPATAPPAGRVVLVNGLEAWVTTPAGRFALTSQRYAPSVLHPDGVSRIVSFSPDPWPTWLYRLEDGTRIEHDVFVVHGRSTVVVAWRLVDPRPDVWLNVRPLLSGRDYHSLHHENGAFRFDADHRGSRVTWRPYDGLPGVTVRADGHYHHDPGWYRNFLYEAERERGLDDTEDLASPGLFYWDLSSTWATLVMTSDGEALEGAGADQKSVLAEALELRARERDRRATFASPLHRAADAYVVARGSGRTIIAGYPWFTDWGRDTFISLRGLLLATGRLDDARDILMEWAGLVSGGMLPNRFPDSGSEPEFNAVDASLWFVICVHELMAAAESAGRELTASERARLLQAVEEILTGYAAGTRYGIRLDTDGLLAAGVPGLQLTWMDAKVGDWVVTPRIGKPVEVQALWLNALWCAGQIDEHWLKPFERGRMSFRARFWNKEAGCLYDVIDVDHVPGAVDGSLRPNQIFAVGGLPVGLLGVDRARKVVDAVEASLLTPLGPRTLAPSDPAYIGRYEGGPRERDGAYHQGTVWPWLMGPFVEAWVRVRGGHEAAREAAAARFMPPLKAHLQTAGLGHVSEITDGDAPFTPRGCPFQAWSLGELLRLELRVLALPRDAAAYETCA